MKMERISSECGPKAEVMEVAHEARPRQNRPLIRKFGQVLHFKGISADICRQADVPTFQREDARGWFEDIMSMSEKRESFGSLNIFTGKSHRANKS